METLEIIKAIEAGTIPAGIGFTIFILNRLTASVDKISKNMQEMNIQLAKVVTNQTNDRDRLNEHADRLKTLESKV